MSLREIWAIAAPMVIAAVSLLVIGLVLSVLLKKMKEGFLKNIVRFITRILTIGPLLFLLYTFIRAIIFLFFLK